MDIGLQLVHGEVGKKLNVILGGGKCSLSNREGKEIKWTCCREDGRDLIQEWRDLGTNRAFVNDTNGLMAVSDKVDHLLGKINCEEPMNIVWNRALITQESSPTPTWTTRTRETRATPASLASRK